MKNIIIRKLQSIKNKMKEQIPECDKKEFYQSIDRINVARGEITAFTFLVTDIVMLLIFSILWKDHIFHEPHLYYISMYVIMILIMAVFLKILRSFKKNITRYGTQIYIFGIFFVSFILAWCAGITLLDQSSGGEMVIYGVAIISIAVTPIYRPINLLLNYFSIHIIFLTLLPHFTMNREHLYGKYINSTIIIIISFMIACMRYKKRAEDFINRKELQQKSIELERVNNELEEANRKLMEANDKLEKLSKTDSLTGINNRFVFDFFLEKQWSICKREKAFLSLIMVDIDFFKSFNDNYGHQAGDNCLKQVAEILSDCIENEKDALTRYGGEEFAIILPFTGREEAKALAEKMRSRVELKKISHAYSDISKVVTISLGVHTVIPEEGLLMKDFICQTDMALYEAKNHNRNQVVVAYTGA